jgi:hypothetical protein
MSEMTDYYPIGGDNVPIDIQNKELPLSNGGQRNFYGSSKGMVDLIRSKGNPKPGNRDDQAGITYYTPKQGVNPKTMIQPIIGPRILDKDVWGNSSIVRDDINNQTFRDVTESELDLEDRVDRDGTRRSLGVPITYLSRTPGARVPQNYVNEPTNHASYPGGQMLYGGLDERDFNANIVPLYTQKNSFPLQDIDMKSITNRVPGLNRDSYLPVDSRDELNGNLYYNLQITPTNEQVMELVDNNIDRPPRFQGVKYGGDAPDFDGYAVPPQQQPRAQQGREPFRFVEDKRQFDQQNAGTTKTALSDIFYNEGTRVVPSTQYYDVMDRVPPGENVQVTPQTDQLLKASPTYVLTDAYFAQPQTKLFMQDVQPKLYSYAVEQTPINGNLGITYTPQRPPKILDQIQDNGLAYPLYTRIDPQLIRTEGTPGQLERNPTRTNWSSEYSNWQPAPGTVNFEDIYDPRFNSYGDGTRAYSDINLGQINYFYSDVDAYRRPNFITRSNVDFVEYTTPNGRVWPYYNRTASVDDVRAQVENQWMADSTSFREDIMESQMAKRNRENWQLRYAPLRKTANPQGFTFGPGSG